MAGGTTHQQQQQQAPQLAPPSLTSSSTAPTTTPEEDEFLKRNTDCVYFLASPLTCKKGSECEYRHSDIARVNPRDCWYWLNGNCLNPKCAFRHPPLDGLLGADVSTPMAPSVPTPHAAPYGAPKQGVACIFFQKGFCLKGHVCPFLHGPSNLVNNKPPQSVTEQPPKMVSSGPEKSIQEQQKFTPPQTLQKPVEFPPPKGKQTHIPARNGATFNKPKSARVGPPPVMDLETPNPSVYHEKDRILNGKDADEYSREPSPGFDVLVDNELGESEYYHEKDEFTRSRGQDYDVDRPEYDVDFREHRRDYDHYNEQESQFAWDDRRASSERTAHLERRPYPRNESDLRHRISKQRRGSDNGLTSVDRRDRDWDRDRERERDSRHHHRQDQGALSSRLRGRIKIPGRSISPARENVTRVEREIDMGRRNQSRYSPGRPLSLNQNRLRDRIKDNNGDDDKFAGPKRLSELKSGRITESHEDGRKRKPEKDLSFEGPKPLSEILKRKKGTENRISSVITHKEKEMIIPENTKNEEENNMVTDFEPEKETGLVNTENATSADENGKSSLNDDVILEENEGEGGMVDEDALLDEEIEAYDHKDGDYDYDQIDGEEDYNLDEEGEFVDEDEYEKKELVENDE